MTLELTLPAGTTDGAFLWSSPEEDLWVANHGGEYEGMVEFSDGHFLARDRTGNLINAFADIPSAKAAIAALAESRGTLRGAVSSAIHHLGGTYGVSSVKASKHYRRSL